MPPHNVLGKRPKITNDRMVEVFSRMHVFVLGLSIEARVRSKCWWISTTVGLLRIDLHRVVPNNLVLMKANE